MYFLYYSNKSCSLFQGFSTIFLFLLFEFLFIFFSKIEVGIATHSFLQHTEKENICPLVRSDKSSAEWNWSRIFMSCNHFENIAPSVEKDANKRGMYWRNTILSRSANLPFSAWFSFFTRTKNAPINHDAFLIAFLTRISTKLQTSHFLLIFAPF